MEMFHAVSRLVFRFLLLPLLGFFFGAFLFSSLIRGYPTLAFYFGGLVGAALVAAGLRR